MAPTQQAWALYEPPPVKPHRRWQGVALIAAAAASVTLGGVVVGLWPSGSGSGSGSPTATPQVEATHAPSAAPLPPFEPDLTLARPADPDSRYLSLIQAGGMVIKDSQLATSMGQKICVVLTQGYSTEEVVKAIYEVNTDGLTMQMVASTVEAAKQAYCPQFTTQT
jgi:hypothetical protein